MKRSFWLTIPFVLVLSTTAPAQQSKAAKKHLKHGLALFSKADVEGAIVEYNHALEADPAFAEAYLDRGKARRARGDLDGAIADYETAVRIDPRLAVNNHDIAQAYINRGYIRLNRLDLDAALADFDRGIKHDPAEPDAYLKRGRALLIKGDAEFAIVNFDRCIELDPRNPLAFIERAVAHQTQGRDDEAQKDLAHGLKLNSDLRLMIDLHLMDLQLQIREVRRRQAETRKKIA